MRKQNVLRWDCTNKYTLFEVISDRASLYTIDCIIITAKEIIENVEIVREAIIIYY